MATLADFRDERIKKLNELERLGVNPYPARSERTSEIRDITEHFDQFNGSEQTLIGRIMGIRKFGKLAFLVIRDMSGQIQLVFQRGEVEEMFTKNAAGQREIPTDPDKLAKIQDSQIGMGELSLLDLGDFIEASGKIAKTQTGEISLMV